MAAQPAELARAYGGLQWQMQANLAEPAAFGAAAVPWPAPAPAPGPDWWEEQRRSPALAGK